MIKLKVVLLAPPSPKAEAAADAPAAHPVGTRKSRMRTWEIASRAVDLGLQYSAPANPLNPLTAWPLLEQGSFANLQPSYFRLPERERLFKSRFGPSLYKKPSSHVAGWRVSPPATRQGPARHRANKAELQSGERGELSFIL